jgi:hypothetical protein
MDGHLPVFTMDRNANPLKNAIFHEFLLNPKEEKVTYIETG